MKQEITLGVALFLLGVFLLGIFSQYKFHILDRIRWFSNVGHEGFVGADLDSAFNTPPTGIQDIDGAPANSVLNEKILAGDKLTPMSDTEANMNWSRTTSERCYRMDMAEELKCGGSYLQRTNNYKHSHPDSCSAPNHEFVGTFYRPHEGVGATPKTGLPLPPSTQCA